MQTPSHRLFHAVTLLLAPLAVLHAADPADTNYDESTVPAYTLPDPLVCFDGQRVTDAKLWREKRRSEILKAFVENVYGRAPQLKTKMRCEVMDTDTKALDGLATRKQVTIRLFREADAPRIDLLLFIPNAAPRPVPAFLSLNYGNQGVHTDPGIKLSRDTKTKRGEQASRWPLEMILKRGYAVATFAGADIEQDKHGSGTFQRPDAWRQGVRGYALKKAARVDRADDDCGTIGAWAWGLSRALDYLETEGAVDAKKVAVVGHSRTGKTALWAAAQDERFAIAISNNSGAGGAALARRIFGEAVNHSPEIWFCKNYRRFANNEAALPVDQHMLIALIAPRPVYIASATEDRWADPRGEFLSGLHAEPVYRLFGLPGLGVKEMPPAETPVGGTIGYHLRTGKHDITPYDWQQYLNFADRHLGPSSSNTGAGSK
ncbi:MAG: acetylxylan esterase [Verrucomicrobiia bacterium]